MHRGIAFTFWASKGRKMLSTRLSFQVFVCGSMRADTVADLKVGEGGDKIRP